MAKTLPDDPTLEEIREFLAMRLPEQAAFDGWNEIAVVAAAEQAGVDTDLAKLAFSGPLDMIDAWFGAIDAALAGQCPADQLAELSIRERIANLINERLAILAPHREALRRALGVLALPPNVPRAARLGWRTADRMWRLAGDKATDYNHYTKRMTLSAVYASTIAVFLDDESDNFADTRAFLDRRIENIMQFERAKAKLTDRGGDRFSLSQFMGRLRYRG